MLKRNELKRSLRPNRRQLRFESLESRRLLTVSVRQVNADVFISGDAANNTIALLQDAVGQFFIYGDAATAITGDGTVAGVVPDTNAGGGRQFNAGSYKNIYISLGAGDDTVEIAGLQAGQVDSLTINTGDAATGDTVSFSNTTFVGDPNLTFNPNVLAKLVSITTGNGADTVNVNLLTAPSLTIKTGGGNDTLNMGTSGAVTVNGNVSVDLGAGISNLLTVGQNNNQTTIDGSFNITGGDGNDGVNINQTTVGNVAGNLNLNLFHGDDTVNLAQVVAVNIPNGSLYIDLGDSSQFGGSNLHVGNTGVVTVSNDVVIRVIAGDSFLAFDNLSAGNLDIQSGLQDLNSDTIVVKGTYTGNVFIDSGNAGVAGDNFGITAAIAGSLTIVGIGGPKNLGIQGTTAGDTSITFGNGPATVRVGTSTPVTTAALSIKTGTVGDLIQVSRLTSKGLSIDSGAGLDNVEVGTNGAVSTANGSFALSLGDGDDAASVNSLAAYTMSLNGGEGNNTLNVGNLNVASSSINGLIAIHAGAGNDTLNFDRVLSGNDVVISLGNGANALNIGLNGPESSSGSLVLSGGTGVDTITLKQVFMVGNVVVNGGGGSDVVSIDGSSAQGVIAVNAGDGDDQVTLNLVTGVSDLALSLGEGNNTLSVTNTGIVKEASVSAGDGNDLLTFNGNTLVRNLNIAAGGGNNALNLFNGQVQGNISAVTGGGLDNVQVVSMTTKLLLLASGANTDLLGTSNLAVDHLFADFGADNDTAVLNGGTIIDFSLLDGGLGVNSITFNGVTRTKTTTVNF